MHVDMLEILLCARIHEKRVVSQVPDQGRDNRFVRVWGVEMGASKKLAAHFMQTCPIEMQMDISQNYFRGKIGRKHAGEQMKHLDVTAAT